MRLLVVSQYFWPENFGINALVGTLHDRGVEVTVLTGQPNYPDGVVFPGYAAGKVIREDFNGIEIVRLPIFPRGRRPAFLLALNYLSFIVAGYVLAPWLLRRRGFDVIFVYAPSPLLQALPALWLARLRRVPLSLWVQDLWPESLSATGFVKNGFALSAVKCVIRFIYRHADQILVPSEAFRGAIEALVEDREKIVYYPNAYVENPTTATQPLAVQSLIADIKSNFSIVFAGNLGAAQSLETILEAAERLQREATNVRFFLIGSGSSSDWLAQEVERRGLENIVLPGRFPSTAIPGIYAAAAALLVSLSDEPIFALTVPSKIQGYLAAGRPIIASLNGEGARTVIKAGAGIACAAGNSGALADAISTLYLLGADKRAEMGENARRYAVENFSLDRLANDLKTQLDELAAAHMEKHR